MGLLSVDIKSSRKLSFTGAPLLLQDTERPYTEQEIALSKLSKKNGVLSKLVKGLELVGNTGKPLRDVPQEALPEAERQLKERQKEREKLKQIAKRLLNPLQGYTEQEVIERMRAELKVDNTRAERGLYLLAEAGALEFSPVAERYYLGGSTPF